MSGLNPQQQRAVTETEGPMLVLAGAGSGKTKVLTQRVAYLVKNGVHPLSILAITFTNKAAAEMRERIENEIGEDISHMWISTFHSMCVRILRQYGSKIGYSTGFIIYDSDDSLRIIKKILADLGLKDDRDYSPRVVKSAISKYKNNGIGQDDPYYFCEHHYPAISYRFSEIFRLYQSSLFSQNAMDFDDLLLKTYELFTKHPDVLAIYRNRFRYVLVDEYQDTNMIQYHLVRMMSMKYKNIFVVGDDDQSIYAFRGANIANILNFEKDFPGAKVIKLEQNYRSDCNILNVANSIIRNNHGRKGKKLWSDRKTGSLPVQFTAKNEFDEAEFIARQIKERVSDGASYSDFAVLYRLHTLSRIIEEKLRIYSIPYNVYGGLSFYERREIKDILAYLTLIVNPLSNVAFSRIINVPKRGIGSVTLEKISYESAKRGISYLEVARNASDILGKGVASKLKSFADTYEDILRAADGMSVHELISYIVDSTGYKEMLYSEYAHEAESRYENIDELINSAFEFENGSDGTLAEYMQSVALITDMDTTSEGDAVTLMTMHAAKGLEYNTVFVCGMEENIFPSGRAVQEESTEEERRLCYVAVTRAKDYLYLLNSERRSFYGDYVYNPPSRFLDEIEAGLVNNITPKREKAGMQYEMHPVSSSSFFSGDIPKNRTAGNVRSCSGIEVGTRVRHKAFGDGTVVSMTGAGDQVIALVDFDTKGQKKMFLAFAPLEVIS